MMFRAIRPPNDVRSQTRPSQCAAVIGLRGLRARVGVRFPALADLFWNARYMLKKDKSQFGEAGLLAQHLPREGLYLELGCYQPVMYSNTWRLARQGWRGWSIDPEPALRFQWRIFRPRSIFFQRAVTWSRGADRITFYRFPRDIGVLSTVDKDVAQAKAASTERECSELTVQAEFLPALLERFERHWNSPPTLIAMDCEGVDLHLVRSILSDVPALGWPRFLLLEDSASDSHSLLMPNGWRRLGTAGPSSLFEFNQQADDRSPGNENKSDAPPLVS